MTWCNLSLVESLWAGEIAVLSRARSAIARQQSRTDFKFGGNFFGYNRNNPKYTELFSNLFDFATVPFYWQSFEPQQGKPNFTPVDRMVNYLQQQQITIKGHPLVYFHQAGTPEWLKTKSYREVKQSTRQHAFQITARYREKIPYYDIVNEANNIPWANALKYDRQQFLELTRIAAEASAKGYPQVKRIINHCCTWGENVAYGKPPQDSPYRYLQRCIAAEIPFEIIGLQMYYPDRDLFEIDRNLEHFSKLNKPIHITELAVSSAATLDRNAQLQEPRGLWHKPWSESIQADWVEQFYTICYSKPYIQAISWWDLADGGNFWPHGGLVRADMQPKQAYYRLDRLIRQFRNS
jgi:endo-1,4-beta-xylanase